MKRSWSRNGDQLTLLSIVVVCTVSVAGCAASVTMFLHGSSSPAGPSSASTPTYQNYEGYAGNDVIYITDYTGDTFVGTNLNATNVTQNNGGYLDLPNGVASSLSTDPSYQSVYYYTDIPNDPGADQFVLELFVSTAGSSQYLPNGAGSAAEWGAGLLGSAVSYTGLPSGASTLIVGYNQVGVNSTVGNLGDQSSGDLGPYLQILSAGLSIASALVDPFIGVPLALSAATIDFAGALGGFTNANYGVTSNVVNTAIYGDGTVEEWSLIDNGTFNPSDNPNWGWNHYAQGIEVETTLGPSEVSGYDSSGQVTIEAANQLDEIGDSGAYLWGAGTSAATGLKYGIDPADSIQGVVDYYPGSVSVGDAQVTLIQDCSGQLTDFQINTNSSGGWQFFANPACSYKYLAYGGQNELQGQNFASATVAIPSFGYGTSNKLPPIYIGDLVSFHESGLGSGEWSVTMNGATQSQTAGQTIYFLEDNGTYSYTVTLPAGATASGGSVTLSGANVAVTVTVLPKAPTGLAGAGSTAASATIDWTNPTGITLDGIYVLEASDSTGACGSYTKSSEQPVSTSYTWAGLSTGEAYCFEVEAVGNAGTSSSSVALVTATLTSAPTSFEAESVASTTVTLGWTAPTTGPSTGVITSYTVLQALYSGGACGTYSTSYATGSTASSYEVTSLLPSTGYCFEVEAIDAGGASAASPALTDVSTLAPVIPSISTPANNCFGGGTCTGTSSGSTRGSGTTCVISSYAETAGDFLYVAVSYFAGTDIITSVADGGVDSFSYVGGEFGTDQSVAFYDVGSEHGGTVTITVTTSETVYGTCRVGQLNAGTTVGIIGAGASSSVSTYTTVSVTNSASHEPSLLLALYSSNRPSGAWTLESPSGAWIVGGQLATGYNPGTESELFGLNDTTSGTVTFTVELNDTGGYQIYLSGIAIELYL